MSDEIRTRTTTNTVIQNPDGTSTIQAGTDEIGITDLNGSHEETITSIRTATLDGAVLDKGEIGYKCTACNTRPWSELAMTRCHTCIHQVCPRCTKTKDFPPICKACAEKKAKDERWEWLRSINP